MRNIAISPELHSHTVTVLFPAKLYNRKMKLYTFVCITSYQMILLMNKTTHSSYFTEIIISRFKECCLFVTSDTLLRNGGFKHKKEVHKQIDMHA